MTQTTHPAVTTSSFDGVGYLRLSGDIDLAQAEVLRKLGEGVVTDYVGTVRVDLSEVTFLDSSALGALIAIRNKAEANGCVLILEKPTRNARRVFELTGLTGVFTIEPT